MKYRIEPITASYFNLPFSGDETHQVEYVTSLASTDVSCVLFYSGKDVQFLTKLEAGIIIADLSLKDSLTDHAAKAIVFSQKPKYTFLMLLEAFFQNTFEEEQQNNGRFLTSKVSEKSYIESDVNIGEGSAIFPNVSVFKGARIGRNCTIQTGSVIGGVGLGDLWHNGRYNRFVHLGSVVIGDDVTIGTNVSVPRGMLEDTIIGSGTRIANNVCIGHSVRIGKNCYISSGVTIGGACVIEDNSWLAVGATLTDHVTVGENTMIGTGSVLIKDALPGSLYLGNPARKISEREK